MTTRRLGPALLLLAIAVTGCSKSVKDVCSDLADDCPDLLYNECLDDGAALERAVESRDCSGVFGDYLDCVADASCGWKSACADAKAALNACTGPFPQ